MTQINYVAFDPEHYNDNEYLMWEDIATLQNILTKNNYIMIVRSEDFGIVVVEFESGNEGYGAPYPRWVSVEERDILDAYVADDAATAVKG